MLSAALRREQISLRAIDANLLLSQSLWFRQKLTEDGRSYANLDEHHYAPLLISETDFIGQLARRVMSYQPKLVGLTVTLRNRELSNALADEIKEEAPDTLVVFGGPRVTIEFHANDLADYHADCLAIGEGEELIVELARRIEEDSPTLPIQGLYWPDDDAPFESRPLLKQLDKRPLPDYSDMDLAEYDALKSDPPFLPLMISRGCPNRCTFCNQISLEVGYRERSIEHVVGEIRAYIEEFGIRRFVIYDSVCNAVPGRIAGFAQALIDQKLDIQWSGNAVIHQELAGPDAALLAASGCSELTFGFESASPAVLRRMNKKHDPPTAARVFRELHRVGVNVSANIITGFPGETEADFEMTLTFLRELAPLLYDVKVNRMQVRKGSATHLKPRSFGIVFDGQAHSGEQWTDEVGNTLAVRQDREKRLRFFIDQQWQKGADPGRSGLPEDWAELHDVRVDPTDKTAIVEIDYQTATGLSDQNGPVIKLQLYAPAADDRWHFLFGMNSSRISDSLDVPLSGTARFEIKTAYLNPGRYDLLATLQPVEDEIVDVIDRFLPGVLVIPGKPEAGPVKLEAGWRIGALSQEKTANDEITMEPQAASPITCGDPWSAVIRFKLEKPARLDLYLAIYRIGSGLPPLAICKHQSDLGLGHKEIRITLPELPLLQGEYRLEFSGRTALSGIELLKADCRLSVLSDRHLGGGLVALPVSLSVFMRD